MTAPLFPTAEVQESARIKRPQLAVPGATQPMGGPTVQRPRPTVPSIGAPAIPSIAGPPSGAIGRAPMSQQQYEAGRAQYLANGGAQSEANSAQYNINPGPNGFAASMGLGGQPSAPGTQVQALQPGQNDLRGTSITATPSPRSTQAANYTTTAAAQYAGNPGITAFQGVNPTDGSVGNASRLLTGAEGAIAGPPGYEAARGYSAHAAGLAGGPGIGSYGGVGSIRNPNAVTLPDARSYGVVGPGDYQPGADTLAARRGVSEALGTLTGTPDRQALAARSLALLEQESAPQFANELRQVGQKAAALGRIGSGMTTSDLGDVAQRRQESLARARERTAIDTAGQEIQDRINRLTATQGVFGQLGGEDRSNEGLLAAQRGEARTERGFVADQDALRAQIAGQNEDRALSADTTRANLGLEGQRLSLSADQARAANQLDRANLFRGLSGDEASLVGAERSYGLDRGKFLAGLSDQTFGQGQSLRNEARTERDARLTNETARFNADRSRFGDFQNYEGDIFNRESSLRNELRGERGYQDDLARQAQEDAINQYLLERSTRAEDFGMNQDELDQLIRLGYLGDPAGAEAASAGALDRQASGLGDAAAAGIAALGNRRRAPGMSVSQATNILDYTPQVVGPR